MSVFKIRKYPDPVLLESAKPVEKYDDNLMQIIEKMVVTLHDAEGLGLAAPQVGISLQLFIYQLPEPDAPVSVVLNPRFIKAEGSLFEEEGCLSIPDYRVKVKRFQKVTLQYNDLSGKELTMTAENLLARVLQHESDHLNGVLFINRISSIKRNIFLRKLRKQLR